MTCHVVLSRRDCSTNQQRRVGIVDYIADIEESVTVGIAGMSFSPLATFTQPVLIDDYDYFILALQTPGSTSVMYLNAGLDDVNVTSKSGENMPFYATNVIPYGQTIEYVARAPFATMSLRHDDQHFVLPLYLCRG